MTDLAWTRPKLAELCELTAGEIQGLWDKPLDAGGLGWIEHWRPDKDIAQAIRCMTAVRCGGISERLLIRSDTQTTAHWECQLQFEDSTYLGRDTDSPARAIVLAIIAALGWQKTGEP